MTNFDKNEISPPPPLLFRFRTALMILWHLTLHTYEYLLGIYEYGPVPAPGINLLPRKNLTVASSIVVHDCCCHFPSSFVPVARSLAVGILRLDGWPFGFLLLCRSDTA